MSCDEITRGRGITIRPAWVILIIAPDRMCGVAFLYRWNSSDLDTRQLLY